MASPAITPAPDRPIDNKRLYHAYCRSRGRLACRGVRRTIVAAGLAAWSAPALAPVCPPIADALRIARRVESGGIALTFDDGPHPQGTPAILEVLADAKA